MTKPKILNSFADLGKAVEVEPRYLRFEVVGKSQSGLTDQYMVYEKKGVGHLAACQWSGEFRQYVFFALPGVIFTADAIRELAVFLDRINQQHINKNKK